MRLIKKILAAATAIVLGSQLAIAGATSSYVPQAETLGATLRRLASAAAHKNPYNQPQLLGAQPWIQLTGAYPGNAAVVAAGTLYSNAGHIYYAAVGGTTGTSTAPTGTNRTLAYPDGSITWLYYGLAAGDIVSNGGYLFQVVTPGVPATTGSGPTPGSLSDGTITWAMIGLQTSPVLTQINTHNAALTNVYNPVGGLSNNSLVPDGPNTANGSVFRWEGGWPVVQSSGFGVFPAGPDISPVTGNCNAQTAYSGLQIQCNYESVEFVAEAAIVEINTINTGTYAIQVDGQYIKSGAGPNTVGGATLVSVYSGGNARITLDFTNIGGRAAHTIKLEMTAYNLLRQVSVGPYDYITYPNQSDNFGVAFVGSSLTAGTGATGTYSSWSNVFRQLVGLPDAANFAIGGTGLLNPGTSTPYISHFMADLSRYAAFRGAPKVIFVEADINDVSYGSTAAQITTAATTLIKTLRAAYPGGPKGTLIVGVASQNVGQGGGSLGTCGTAIQCEAAVQAAFTAQAASGDQYIGFIPNYGVPTPPGPVLTGTGHQTTLDGTCNGANATGSTAGNNYIDLSSSGPHPNDCGYMVWAKAIVAAYRAIINALP
ncbi:exported hypothetical protein [Methylocella tundrae]|uniref:SGNH hydrolase-type esterase domain-containing protein n=1 Tax=Methylocella tundrae TaxID=227605 RepID=A0A8B6MBT5_METTU|nr:SGNH/GDSL hydrolase family protein [Methylocella tundrae]VTZ24354.1 exported hypothetical protein [Methylocella tundrae]VTZ52463.1 exported hypothetical protein [Methylocella tundrae]